jgi:hypothetical protein
MPADGVALPLKAGLRPVPRGQLSDMMSVHRSYKIGRLGEGGGTGATPDALSSSAPAVPLAAVPGGGTAARALIMMTQ